MKKNKLAVVIPTLRGAGCEKTLSEMLFDFGQEFEVDLVLYAEIIDYDIPENINIKLIGTDDSPNHTILYKIFRLWKRIYNIGKILKKNKYDAIISFIDGCNTNVYLGKKLFNLKTPLITAEHTINDGFFEHNPYGKRFAKVFKFLLKITYDGADEVVVISESMKKYLYESIGVKNKNITTIYNGIDAEKFNLTKNENVQFEVEFQEAKIRLLNVARLDDQKNQQYLIQLMPNIIKEKHDAKLFIIGKGEKEEELKKLIKELNLENNVFLLGWKTNVADYLRESDLFLMSSKYESFGNVVAEALMCGLPVISSNYEDVIYEIISQSDLGATVELNDKIEYKNSIIKYLDITIDKRRIHAIFNNKFDIQKTKEEYINLIKKVIHE
jgi:glycosyltransferase involved in cell wall biosynthesis